MDKRAGWVVGRVAGAPVVLRRSALVMVAILTVLFLPTVNELAPSLGSSSVVGSFAVVVVLMVSVFLHEIAHAVTARARGLEVHELALTLWGGHTSFTDTRTTPATSALVAIVGPLTNVAIALLAWFAYDARQDAGFLALLLYVTAYSNMAVAIFNLLPGLPLDGGQVVEAAVWAATGRRLTGTIVAAWTGRTIGVLVLLAAVVLPGLLGRETNLLMVVWAAFIGAFMWSSASQSLTASRFRARAEALDTRDLARPAVALDAAATVAEVREAIARNGAGPVVCVLTTDGHPVGYVDDEALGSVPGQVAATTPAWAVGIALPPGSQLDVGLRGLGLHSAVVRGARRTGAFVVTDGGRPVGLLHVTDVIRAVRLD